MARRFEAGRAHLFQHRLHLLTRSLDPAAGVDDEVGASALVGVRHLAREDLLQPFRAHARPGQRPLALLVPSDTSDSITSLHRLIFDAILALIWCHVVAVGFYLLVKRDNLVLPMLTGRKPHSHLPQGVNLAFTRLIIALLLFFLSAGIAAWIMIEGASLP